MIMEKNKAVLSIGVGPGQLEFIRRLKELGYTVVAFGKGKNSSEAVSLCDHVAEIDTRDYEAAKDWVDALPVEIIAVGSFAGGAAVPTVQRLANHYGVCTSIPDSLVVGTNKLRQQSLYNELGLSGIRTWKKTDLSPGMISSFPDDERYIIKPMSGRGSEGIRLVDKEGLVYELSHCLEDSDDLIQTVREGDEYRCLIIIQNGRMKLLAPILRRSYRDTVFLGTLRYCDKDIDRISDFFEAFVSKCHIVNTIIKVDIIVSDLTIDVIEMDIGVGGGTYYKRFISRLYDCDLMDDYIKLIMGKELDDFVVKKPDLRMDYVFNHYDGPVIYNPEKCKSLYDKRLGPCEMQINTLHPERKGSFASNADFIFTVMYEDRDGVSDRYVDDLANQELFKVE